MELRDTHRRSHSPHARSRSRRRSRSSSSERWPSSDNSTHFSRRSHRSNRHNSPSRSRSRSPREFERSRHYSHANGCRSAAKRSQDAALYDNTFRVSKTGNRRLEERGIRPVDSAKAEDRGRRRITPNASALRSIMLGTARLRDRMDERERARAKQKLESLKMPTE